MPIVVLSAMLMTAAGLIVPGPCAELVTHRHSPPFAMAGFGAAKPAKAKGKAKKPPGISTKSSWDMFRELRSSDKVLTSSVFAKLPEDEAKWMNVGGIIVEAPGSRVQAVTAQKRLILEHAARLHPKLALRSRELLCGYSDTEDGVYRGGEVLALEKCAAPESAFRSGFQGLPHLESGTYVLKSKPRGVQ